ncbi:hypothetical protein [Acetobacterium wieringae]|uniref:hypothetical protein n=1 Tax=Acetobacterium wieringae TaxID=52694 RepID=UPI0031586473
MAKKNCIIVYGSEETVPANLLAGLIGEKGEYTVALWDEKVYKDSSSKITSDQEIIFIGETKPAKDIIPSIKFEYEISGMKYGWIGNRAVIYVEKRILSKEEFEMFKTDYQAQDDLLQKFIESSPLLKIGLGVGAAITGPIAGVGLLGALGLSWVRGQEIRKSQFDCVIKAFFNDGLAKFMEA